MNILPDELVVDNFAGAGGASTGIERALGRAIDIAVNHDADAIRMHRVNHPRTKHLCENVWKVDPVVACAGRPVGLAWFSPDCTHHSKARGTKPVKKHIRGLAWVVLRWAATVRPRIINLENVEEFMSWGPVVTKPDGNSYPCPKRKGRTFKSFLNELRKLGYAVDHRMLRACDYGDPTIRKRLFLIARCDGQPIVWPEATHGDPKSEAVKSGRLLPWRTAAECIQWEIPAPSIFERKKPLAEATQRRIHKGINRYVVDAAEPFIVTYYGDKSGEFRGQGVDEPLRTQTTENRHGLVMPFMARTDMHKSNSRCVYDITDPLRTVTSAGGHALVTPYITEFANTSSPRSMPIDEPLRTICAQVKGGHFALVAPHITKFHTNSVGSDIDTPMPTVTANSFKKRPGGAAPIGLVSAHLQPLTHQGADRTNDVREPFPTITAAHRGEIALVSPTLIQTGYGERRAYWYCPACKAEYDTPPTCGCTECGAENDLVEVPGQSPRVPGLDKPLGTVVAGGAKHALVSAFLAKHYTGVVGSQIEAPLGTVTAVDHHSLVSSHLVKLKGDNIGQDVREPLQTITAGGLHFGEVRAFMIKYYGTDQDPKLNEPLHTVTTKDRFGLVEVKGENYQIVDIGLRMLAPRELFRAQGFYDSYIIDHDEDGKPFTKTAQVKLCGNSVCPGLAAALVSANTMNRLRNLGNFVATQGMQSMYAEIQT